MRKMLNKCLLFVFLILGFEVVAQGGGPPPPVPPPPGLPVNDNLLFLFVGALLYGLLKIYFSIVKK